MIDTNIKYIYLFFLILIFFIYGLTLSEIIDYIFPDHDELKNDYRTAIEMIGEIGVTYLIYFSLKKYIEPFINILFNKISKPIPKYLDSLLLMSFSFGIYKHLQKSNNKMLYLRKKIINL